MVQLEFLLLILFNYIQSISEKKRRRRLEEEEEEASNEMKLSNFMAAVSLYTFKIEFLCKT